MAGKTQSRAEQSTSEPEAEESLDDMEVAHGEGPGEVPSFPIVGIGASAGGLEAYTELLKALPSDANMAFVLVQHLSPHYQSMLAEILQRATPMPVVEVQDEPEVLANHVYVIPPNRNMILSGGCLKLLPRLVERGQHRPIDAFLRSLAEDRAHQAVGVILSGTGNDGTLGLEAIKAEGGLTFAQDEESAQQDGMPRSAVAAGAVDFVLPPQEIARELLRIGRHSYVTPPPAGIPEVPGQGPPPGETVRRILRLVHDASGVDFANYKSTTLYRRITRRMLLHRLEGLDDYLRFLREHPTEVDNLYRDILISVTCFFRDPEAVEGLKSRVLPALLENRSRQDPLRIWVLGCSTGEEAYSLAILAAEATASLGLQVPAQIFATDLNEHGIDRARAGVYSKDIAQDVSPERLRRFFVETDAGYQIRKPIRDMCIFARQNVLADPPFSRMDLITCRNLLIYMEPVLQRKVVPLFHYALRPGGYLWLGSSETIGSFSDLFEVVDARHKIYSKKAALTPPQVAVPLTTPMWAQLPAASPRRRSVEAAAAQDLQREADRLVLARYAPPGVLVNGDFDILHFRGDTSPFLASAPGKPSVNILKMAREGLLVGLRSALQKAIKEGGPVRQEGLLVKSNGGRIKVDLDVTPVRVASSEETSYLVLFERAGAPQGHAAPHPLPVAARPQADGDAGHQIAHLTQELATTREYLQSLIEQQEAANEELQSANEEIQSSNEELQSINEELQTSKEEIQSSNEELITLNEELFNRNQQLTQANDDLSNFLASTQLALVVLGRDLTIRHFTPQAEKQLNLIAADVGRPIGDLNLPLSLPDLHQAIAEVIDSVQVTEREAQDKKGRWYSLRLRPYKTADNRIDGAVLVLVDIDEQKRTELELRAGEEKYRLLVDGAKDMAIMALDADGRVSMWNDGAERLFGYAEEEILGRPMDLFFIPEDLAKGLPRRELERATRGQVSEDENWLVRKDGTRFWASGGTTGLFNAAGQLVGFSKVVRDISERKQAEDALRESEERFRLLADHAPILIWLNGPTGCEYVNRSYLEFVGADEAGVLGEGWLSFVHPADRDSYLGSFREAEARRERFEAQFRFRRSDGEYRWMQSIGLPRRTGAGDFVGYVGSTVEIDDIKRAEQALRDADHRKNEFLAVLAHELRNPLAPIRNSLEILRVAPLDGESARVSREVMERQVRMLTRMVDDLLDVSRIARGKIELKSELVDLRATIRLAVEGVQFHLEAKGHRLVLELPEEAVHVQGDVVRLEQVIANLLSNAVKYTDGSGVITVTLERQGGEAVIRVRDTGIGIDGALLPHIFDLFTQADTSLGREGGGLGIGLSLVRQLVELHQGSVQAESEGLGQGTTFEVRLPLVSEARIRKARWVEGAAELAETVAPVRRVLVVDDNVDAAETLARLLRLFGHEVEVAFNGPSALEAAASFRPGLVLLDIGMPQMDGYEVARRLRQQEDNGDLALVALSGYGTEEDRQKAREAGFDLHLVKPVDPATLQKLLAGQG